VQYHGLIIVPYIKKYHKTDRKLIKIIIPNTSKSCHTSSSHGSMRLIRQRNNSDNETLIYIPLSHVTIAWVHTTRIAKWTTNY